MCTEANATFATLRAGIASLKSQPLAVVALRAELRDLRDEREHHLMVCPGSPLTVRAGF